MPTRFTFFQRHLRLTYLSILSGVLAGLASTLFLVTLQWATETRKQIPLLMLGLPLAGLLTAGLYKRFGKTAIRGHNLILDEIHDPQKVVPIQMAPLVWVSTLLTHLCGGSAGREGTAVQMGASLSDQLSHFFRLSSEERRTLLRAGTGAGFSSAIGTPWAGAIFGMEVVSVGTLRLRAWYECLVASFVGYYTAVLLRAPHSLFPKIEISNWNFSSWFFVVCAGAVFGLAARLFTAGTHLVERIQEKSIPSQMLKPFLGGILVLLFFYLEGSYRYAGLGISTIQEALKSPSVFWEPLFKTIASALTVGSGFKGGEFIPLVFVGATLGSALSVLIPISFSLLGALGFAAVFAGAANTPIACTLMAMELFGPTIGPYALIACFASYFFSSHHGIYKSQRIHRKKHEKLFRVLNLPL